jgi:hypothetical protein
MESCQIKKPANYVEKVLQLPEENSSRLPASRVHSVNKILKDLESLGITAWKVNFTSILRTHNGEQVVGNSYCCISKFKFKVHSNDLHCKIQAHLLGVEFVRVCNRNTLVSFPVKWSLSVGHWNFHWNLQFCTQQNECLEYVRIQAILLWVLLLKGSWMRNVSVLLQHQYQLLQNVHTGAFACDDWLDLVM